MNVTYITHYPELYGANRSLLDLLLELKARGTVRPHVMLPREGPLLERLRAHDIPFRVMPYQPWMSERRYEGRLHHRIAQHWRYEKPARARRSANRQLLPALVDQATAWGSRLLHANSSVVGIGRDLADRAHLPLVWHIREMPERQYGLHLDEGRGGYAAALREADRLIAISEAVREDILRYATPVRPIAVIPNGVLHRAAYGRLRDAMSARWARTEPFVFALIGLIHPSKGQLEAVSALADCLARGLPVRLVLAGDGRDEALRAHIQRLGVAEQVELPGFVQDPYTVLRRAHVLLMCSRNEAMGRVTVEAMASGLPVIGHRSGATPEIVEHEVTGLLYADGEGELAGHMARLAADPELARTLGARGSVLAEERYSIERYADAVMDVYRSVLSAR